MSRRLDQYLVSRQPGISRAGAAQIIKSGQVKVNGRAEVKPGYRLKDQDKIDVAYKEPTNYHYPKLSIPIIYEDDNVVVIDKPAGILVHSKGGFNPEATVETWLSSKVSDLSGPRAGIVHRLDRTTSGVMILAKNAKTLKQLQKQFSDRLVKKQYRAIVIGHLKDKRAVIDMPIERHPKKRQSFRASLSGRSALTRYQVVKEAGSTSLVDLLPETGRTHQLRVHLAKIGHPIVGDKLYSGPPADRVYLHASSLALTLPGVGPKIFSSRLPRGFLKPLQ